MSDSAWRYFKLKRDPFGSLPDPALFYTTRARREAYSSLLRAIEADGGLFVLMGEAGIGKTALLRRLEAELRCASYQVVSERRAGLSFNDLISILSHATCISEPADDFDQWLARFHEVSADRARAQSPLVLLIEEADGLGAEAASRLDRLLNLQSGQPGGLRLVLDGKVSLRLLARLEAKVRFTFLTRLDDSEIGGFIYHRLRCSGCRDPDFFSLGAIDEVARRAGGLPQQINLLCAGALRLASADACSVISAEHVEMAARQLVPPAATASARESAFRTPMLRRIGLLVGPPAAAASIAAGIIVGLAIYLSGGREGGAGKEQFAGAVVEAAASQARAEAPAVETGTGPEREGISAPLLDVTRPDIETIRAQLVDDGPHPEETVPEGANNVEIVPAAIAPHFAATDASLPPKSSATPESSVANTPPMAGSQAQASGIAKGESPSGEERDETADGTLAAAADETPGGVASGQAANSAQSAGQSAAVAALVARAAIQLAGDRISDPAGDNALETYRQISSLAPESPETHRLREQIRDALGESARAAVAAEKWQEARRLYELAIHPELDIPEAEIGTSPAVPGSDIAAVPAAEPAASPDTLPPTEAPVSSDASKSEPPEQPKREQPSGLGAQAASAGEAGKAAPPQPGNRGVAVPAAPPTPPAPRISGEIMTVLMKRGDQLLAIGDISAARLVYERAASDGSARAMIALGMTYDQNFLSRANVRGIRPDPAIAAGWYAKAAALGDAEAASRIERLQALAPQ